MRSDLEAIGAIAAMANGKTVGGELGFVFPDVLGVIDLCSASRIAVLGVEVFLVRGETYETTKMSDYDLPVQEWPDYVFANNRLAEEFVRANPAGDEHIFVLTTSSWREFREIEAMKLSGLG